MVRVAKLAEPQFEPRVEPRFEPQSEPRLDWECLLPNPTLIQFNEEGMRQLIALIESRPNELLFRVPESPDSVHPPLRTRILYLWHNRREIECQIH